MEDRDVRAADASNAAMLAESVLLLLTRVRRGVITSLNEETDGSLDALYSLLIGTANGAESRRTGSDLSPAEGRSLSADLKRYDRVKAIKRELSDEQIHDWTKKAAETVQNLRAAKLRRPDVDDDLEWIAQELEP